ncbi:MAG: (deoxy)nucleoside triphosphate pyrophosphohydrolase [Candidatus Omnitrophica bacterium]|nr:(deoxy)nucleoside triphosphate pyrophosphohydrolase [Candidatus Omnitrophota bacterium]
MSAITVACAMIVWCRKLLIAQRKPGSRFGGYWEFPGGKPHLGEKMEDCLIREVYEELGIWILPKVFFGRSDQVYSEKEVALYFYLCVWLNGYPTRKDCLNFAWVLPPELRRYRFMPGDQTIINELIRKKTYYFSILNQA